MLKVFFFLIGTRIEQVKYEETAVVNMYFSKLSNVKLFTFNLLCDVTINDVGVRKFFFSNNCTPMF